MAELGELEVLFLLSFTEAPPSYVLAWLESRGISYRLSDETRRVIVEDEKAGSRVGIRTSLEASIRELEFRLESFSSRVDTLEEVFNITLLVAPVMLYSIGFFRPGVVQGTLPLLLALNAALVVLYRDLHPRVLSLPRSLKLATAPLLISAASVAVLLYRDVETALTVQAIACLPLAVLAAKLLKTVENELKENREMLVRSLQSPGHVFRAVSPEALLAETALGLSRSIRLTVYFSSVWGIEDPSLLLLTYEKIHRFHRNLVRKGFTSAALNLVTLFLLGFASAVVKSIFNRLPLESVVQWVPVEDPHGVQFSIDMYLLASVAVYSVGLSVLSTGSPAFTALWLPIASLAITLGSFFGGALLGGGNV